MEELTGRAPGATAGFMALCEPLLTDTGDLRRPTRAADQVGGFDTTAFASADLLEVHFADGSVWYTQPQEFAARHAGGPLRSDAADGTLRLPFVLAPLRGTGTTRAGAAGVPVDRYRIARLTPRTTLDTVYAAYGTVSDALRRWLGTPQPGEVGHVAAALCHAFETSQLDHAVGDAVGALLAWTDRGWVPAGNAPVPEALAEVVLLLHGTASSTRGSFTGLWQAPGTAEGSIAADWSRLVSAPGRLVLAYDHRSLTASPTDNVLDLLQQLRALGVPAGTTFHLLSHSRGGLVGELLTLVLGTPAEVQARARQLGPVVSGLYGSAHADAPATQRLLAVMADAETVPGWRAGNFVRVACPARGTLLADRRTDLYLSLLLRSVGLAFGVNGNPRYEQLRSLVRALVATRADARRIPGLEAMIPGAPLSLLLNAPGTVELPGRLRVVAGDSQGLGTLGLATLLGDVFYGLHDHDFVVHTHAMFGGFPRQGGDRRSRRFSGPAVHHLGYFAADSQTRAPVLAALQGNDQGFVPLAEDEARTRGPIQALHPELSRRPRAEWLRLLGQPAAPQRPILVVLPGIMGSELAPADHDGGRPVWLSPASMFDGALARLDLHGAAPLRASGLMALSYERLLARAMQHFHVVTFPFDWRQPIPAAAGELIELLKELLPPARSMGKPVHLMAHSMGGLVARLALWCDGFGLAARRGDTTAQLEALGLRLVQCGTPNLGSYAPLQLLMQQHPLTRNIARLARGVTPRDLARFGAAYPGLMGMMPAVDDPRYGDLFQWSTWGDIEAADAANANSDAAITKPDPGVLADAAQVRDWLRASFDALKSNPRVHYVAGRGLTPLHLKVVGGSPGRPGLLRLGVSMRGDGTVPWSSVLAPERTYYIDAEHGGLLDHVDAFDGIFDLLLGGRTRQLPTQPPALRSDDEAAGDAVFELPALPSLPEDPAAHVLGLDRRTVLPGRLPPIRVRVVHGSLDYARYPLLVGHCSDDGMHGAVRRVDTKLRGQLQQAVDFGLFTGALGTSQYLREMPAQGRAPVYPGAIVVGLGPLGTLTPAALADTLARAVLDHAFARLHNEPWSAGTAALVLNLSAVLVGSNTHSLAVKDSLAGILQGLWRAGQALAADRSGGRQVRIGELEIIELHETVALDAAYALARLLERPDWQQRVHWPQGVLESREGGVRGYRAAMEVDQWQRLGVRCDDFGGMKFELIAERARVESVRNRGDIAGLEDLIAQACDQGAGRLATAEEQDEFGRGLYNLLLPVALRGRLANFERTVLLLDDRSARMPWELLAPPRLLTQGEEAAQPLALQAGMLRQRLVQDYRAEVRPALRRPGTSRRVLVIGEPDTAGWQARDGRGLRYAELPSARAEAGAVAGLMSARGWQVTQLVRGEQLPQGASYADVRRQLMRPVPWRVLHLSGHGVVDQWVRDVQTASGQVQVTGTGMVLSGQHLLTADIVAGLDPPPEFVFINCCYSGRDGEQPSPQGPQGLHGRPALAASLALAFIGMGSKAVVAAGWQVDDADGRDFAEALYRSLLQGDSFGTAVLAARHAIWRDGHPRSNTWGAYQCYGSPDWRLVPVQPDAGSSPEADALAGADTAKSPQELADRIFQVLHGAGDGQTAVFKRSLLALQQRLSEDTVRAAWLQDSLVLSAFAMAWRELGETQAALDAAFEAISRPHSQFSLGQAEKTANLLSKLGEVAGGRLDAQAAQQASLGALERLDRLTDAMSWRLAPSPPGAAPAPPDAAAAERDCLRGSAVSRHAESLALGTPERGRGLLEAATWYARGFVTRKRLRENAGERAHALSNAAMLAGIVAVSGPALRQEVVDGTWWPRAPDEAGAPARADDRSATDRVLEDIEATLQDVLQDETIDFWGYAAMLDLRLGRLLLLLAEDRLDSPIARADIDALGDTVDRVLLRWPSPGQLQSLSKRPRQVQDALRLRPGSNGGGPKTLQDELIEAVGRVIERIDEARTELAR